MPDHAHASGGPAALIDPRGPRFGAAVTSVLLAGALLAGPSTGLPLLLVQTFAFAAGALLGLRYQPWGWVFRRYVRPRLAPSADLEDERPPRFAQAVGLGFAVAALTGVLLGVPALFLTATGLALAAALLNAVFGLCLGCELYLLGARLRARAGAGTGVVAR